MLCEEIVDRVADILEHLAGELNGLSIDAFHADDTRGRNVARAKVQFVLDALVGLIGIAQNDVFKVLTIVSIVGIPPTLMAGIYGMNFKNMPEYDWAWGYQYGWAMILLSAVIPLVWFKVKGWF